MQRPKSRFLAIESGRLPPQEIMALDQRLLDDLQCGSDQLILHLYEWSVPSATYGHFIKPEEHLNLEGVRKCGLHLAKRPTGGGIVFHLCDLAFSVLVPAQHPFFSINTLENYRTINRLVAQAIEAPGVTPELLSSQPEPLDPGCRHFCMAHPTRYDLLVEGRKVGGAAQRRTKFGFLHQGTISLAVPSTQFLQELLLSGAVQQGMEQHSYALLGSCWTPEQLGEKRIQLREALIKIFNMLL